MLYTKIKEDLTASQRSGDSKLVGVLKLIISELSYAQVDFKGGELPDEEVIRVLMKEAKKRKDSIELYQKAGQEARAEQENYELDIIQTYLPQVMSEEDLLVEISKLSEETGLRGGRLMGSVMGKLRGKVDGALVQKVVNEKFPG